MLDFNKKQLINYIDDFLYLCFAKKSMILISIIYIYYRFFLNDANDRIIQFVYLLYMVGYLCYNFVLNIRNILNKKNIIGFLIIFSSIITIIINKSINAYGIRAVLMLIINFIAYVIPDTRNNDNNDILYFLVLVVFLGTFIIGISTLICAITDDLEITNLNVHHIGDRLNGFTYCVYTGDMAVYSIGASIYLLISKFRFKKKCINNALYYINVFNLMIECLLLFLAQSRCSIWGTILVLLILLSIYIYKYNINIITNNLKKFVLVILLFVAIIFSLNYFGLIFIRPVNLDSSGRWELWYAFLSVFFYKQNIWFGIGPSRFIDLYRKTLGNGGFSALFHYFDSYQAASQHYKSLYFFKELLTHNEYIREMILFGIIGLVLFISFLIKLLYNIIQLIIAKKNTIDFKLFVIIAFFIIYPLFSGLVENMFSISNSPRFLGSFCFFVTTGIILDIKLKGVLQKRLTSV